MCKMRMHEGGETIVGERQDAYARCRKQPPVRMVSKPIRWRSDKLMSRLQIVLFGARTRVNQYALRGSEVSLDDDLCLFAMSTTIPGRHYTIVHQQ